VGGLRGISQCREKQRAIELLVKRNLQIRLRQQKPSTKQSQSGHLGGAFGALIFYDRFRGPTKFVESQLAHPSDLTKPFRKHVLISPVIQELDTAKKACLDHISSSAVVCRSLLRDPIPRTLARVALHCDEGNSKRSTTNTVFVRMMPFH